MILVETDAGEEWDSRVDWNALAERAVLKVQAERGLAGRIVGTVAGEAAVRQNRFDVEVEVYHLGQAFHFRHIYVRTACGDQENYQQDGYMSARKRHEILCKSVGQ